MTRHVVAGMFLILFMLSPAYAETDLFDTNEKTFRLTDRRNEAYTFRQMITPAENGYNDLVYTLNKTGNFLGPAEPRIEIFRGKLVAQGRDCKPVDVPDVTKVVTEYEYQIDQDINGDQRDDLKINIEEKDCKTGKRSYKNMWYLSKDNGFVQMPKSKPNKDSMRPIPMLRPVAIVKNAQRYFAIKQMYDLNHGNNYYKWTFGPEDGPEDQDQFVFEGRSFGDGNGCPSEADRDRTSVTKAMVRYVIIKEHLNSDKAEDMVLSLIERDCKTDELTFRNFTVLSTPDGYNVTESKSILKP